MVEFVVWAHTMVLFLPSKHVILIFSLKAVHSVYVSLKPNEIKIWESLLSLF